MPLPSLRTPETFPEHRILRKFRCLAISPRARTETNSPHAPISFTLLAKPQRCGYSIFMMKTMMKQAKLLRSVYGPTDAEVAAYEAQRAAVLARLDAELAKVQAEIAAKRAKAGV